MFNNKNRNNLYSQISDLKNELKQKDKTIDSLKIILKTYVEINSEKNSGLSSYYKKLRKGVVLIVAGGGKSNEQIHQGSGFLISKSGIGITNNHVVAGHDILFAVDYLGIPHLITEILDSNEYKDYVFFQLENQEADYHFCDISNSKPKIGEKCFAISNPHGFENTLTTGVVSSFRGIDTEDEFIQTNTSVAPGSSGAPLFNKKGRVIGVVTSYIKGDNMTFALNIKNLPIREILRHNIYN